MTCLRTEVFREAWSVFEEGVIQGGCFSLILDNLSPFSRNFSVKVNPQWLQRTSSDKWHSKDVPLLLQVRRIQHKRATNGSCRLGIWIFTSDVNSIGSSFLCFRQKRDLNVGSLHPRWCNHWVIFLFWNLSAFSMKHVKIFVLSCCETQKVQNLKKFCRTGKLFPSPLHFYMCFVYPDIHLQGGF